MADERLVYWDSDAFISRIERTPDRIQALEELTDAAERGQVRIVASILAMAETAKLGQLADLLPEQHEQMIVDFFDNPYITVRPLDYFVAQEARRLVRAHGFGGADAVHVATAILNAVPTYHTWDGKLLKADGHIEGLHLEEPQCTQPRMEFDP
jgi:predicted nucleic acid-binding protein